jgi:hypothetical protein
MDYTIAVPHLQRLVSMAQAQQSKAIEGEPIMSQPHDSSL